MSLAALLNDRLIQEVKKIGEVHKIGVSSKFHCTVCCWPFKLLTNTRLFISMKRFLFNQLDGSIPNLVNSQDMQFGIQQYQ